MKLSPYFHDLRSAYQAELDDLASDSEGNDVLRRRLAEKRNEIAFLSQMLELAPEMVAVVFHKAFRFARPATLETMLGQAVGDLPDWHELGSAVTLEPWAQSLAQAVLAQPGGARFMAVAAGLEYLHQHAHFSAAAHAAAGEGADADADLGDDGETAEHDDDFNVLSADDAVEPRSDRDREEAGASWLADAGFERKD